jgi:tRNA(adenine34) deaminase
VTPAWESLEPPWRECFLLAWESFRAGSIPVGAVLLDGAGTAVSRGRNRRSERCGPDGQLSASGLAHAEINALVTLPPADYSDHVMYTTLEPCLLCTAALRQCHVGTVRFAGPDPLFAGIDRIPDLGPMMARRWTRREGPLGGPFGRLAVVLHLVWAVENGAQSLVDGHTGTMPDELDTARRLAGPTADRLRALPFPEALRTLLG